MHRTSKGKSIALTPRDVDIFKWLARYRYLRSTYLHAFVGGASETRLKERLGDLFHEGYIDRPERQWEFADARHAPAVYELGARSCRILAEHGEEVRLRTFLAPTAHRQFAHSVMICECLASIEAATQARTDVRFVSWSEILAKAPASAKCVPIPHRIPASDAGVIPDGLFGLEYRSENRKAYRFFALEADRGTMPLYRTDAKQTSLLRKLEAYREIIDRGLGKSHLGLPNLFVLTVVTSKTRLTEALNRFAGQAQDSLFLFAAVDPRSLASPARQFLDAPWQRPGMPPFSIANA